MIKIKPPEIDWQHPLVGANPVVIGVADLMAIQKTLVEAYQKKWFNFFTTGVWK